MDRSKGLADSEAGWLARLVFRAFRKRLGVVPQAKRLAAYDRGTLLASTWMDAVCGSAKSVPLLLKELAQLKVAVMVGCPF